MGIHLSKALWRTGLAMALVVGALMALPFGARAQSGGGSLSASLAGNNGIAVTLSGVASGNVYNFFGCTAVVSTPTPPSCQIATAQLTANSSGQASGTVYFNISNYAISEVFAQNNTNIAEQYSFVLSGATTVTFVAPAVATTTALPTCALGTTLVYVGNVPTCTAPTSTTTCASFTYVNGFPVCTSNGLTTTATCTTFIFVNGVPQCATAGIGTTLGCGGFTIVNGVLVCTTNGLPLGFGGFNGNCINPVLVNGVPACAENGLPFNAIPGCISYSFVNGIVACLLY